MLRKFEGKQQGAQNALAWKHLRWLAEQNNKVKAKATDTSAVGDAPHGPTPLGTPEPAVLRTGKSVGWKGLHIIKYL